MNIEACPVKPALLAALLTNIGNGTVSNAGARQIWASLWCVCSRVDVPPEINVKLVDILVDLLGLRQNMASGALSVVVAQTIAANAACVEQYRAGKSKALNVLVGKAMQATNGTANAQLLTGLFKSTLG